MVDKVKEIPKKILEWWGKFTPKQKTLIVSIALVIIVALGIVIKVLTTPTLVTIQRCEDTKQAAEVKKLLEDADITPVVSDDGLEFQVKAEEQANANIVLGENGIPSTVYDLNSALEGGFSTTESDKTKKYQRYMEEHLGADLEQLEQVDKATVKLNMPVDDGTILAQNEDTYAAVTLTLNDSIEEETAYGLAKWIATAIGNDNTDSISIIDTKGSTLFSGGDSSGAYGNAGDRLSYQTKQENMVKNQVKEVMLATNEFNNVAVGTKLVVDYNQTSTERHTYTVPEGAEHGPIDNQQEYNMESNGGLVGGTPGTDANDDNTTYVTQDGNTSSQTVTDRSTQYKTDEEITKSTGDIGNIQYEDSSITVVLTKYKYYNEDALKSGGDLDDMTFEEFQAANSERTKLEVDEDYIQMAANATGIPVNNISVVAYEVPFFEESANASNGIIDFLPYIIAALIMLMLGFVVFRSTRKEQEQQLEPELSVESLLSSTKEAQEDLEDIGFSEKSETRILIEKFVDENPEAAASLLRNWLNEEWD